MTNNIARRKINLVYLLGFLLYRIWPIFLSQRTDQQIGKNWVYGLIQRRSELKSRFSRRYNYERAKYEDQKIIQEYFDSVHKAILQYGISPEATILMRLALLWDSAQLQRLLLEVIDIADHIYCSLAIENG